MALDPVKRQRTCFQNNSEKILQFLEGDAVVQNKHLYQHQVDALMEIRRQFILDEGPRVALVVLPTGCGKTGIAILAPFVLGSRKVLVVTPAVDISDQILKEFSGKDFFLKTRGFFKEENMDDVCPTTSRPTTTSELRDEHTYQNELLIVNAHKFSERTKAYDRIKEIKPDKFDLVIVDEAHHYPAPTWKTVVDHFRPPAFCLFLTATPEYKGEPILPGLTPCFRLKREDAVSRGIIRNMEFEEVPSGGDYRDEAVYEAIVAKVEQCLDYHDAQDRETLHQAMVLAQTVQQLNAADEFQRVYERTFPGKCRVYTTGKGTAPLSDFNNERIRTLVVVGKLREGYDNKRVSVVAIVRNVAPTSHVLFAQFVGRAVRKLHANDPVTAVVVSHKKFKQKPNYDHFDQVAEEENEDEDCIIVTKAEQLYYAEQYSTSRDDDDDDDDDDVIIIDIAHT